MASSGKKGKKNKGKVISLQYFLSNGGETPVGTTQVAKKLRNFNDDDSDDGGHLLPQVYQLPTAPRASRILDDDSIPHKKPFLAYITNLPFDVEEDDIQDFFSGIPILSVRLPREDGETGRVRGFGYVEFVTRDDLINVISMSDPNIKGRRIRIEVSNESDQGSRQRNNRRYDGFGNLGENRESTNWRRDNQNKNDEGRHNEGRNYDRGYNRDRHARDDSHESVATGSWRTGDRPAFDSSPRHDRSDRSSFNDRFRKSYDNEREFSDRGYGGAGLGGDDEDIQLRPKLNLKPRTLPLPEVVSYIDTELTSQHRDSSENNVTKVLVGNDPEKVFGSAKPVDTASRELEIEERLVEARRQEKMRREREQKSCENYVNEKLSEVQLDKTDKESQNSAISWRRRDGPTNERDNTRQYSPDRKGFSKRNTDERRRDNLDCGLIHENINPDRSDRKDCMDKPQSNRIIGQQDDNKLKRDQKSEKIMSNYQLIPSDAVLQPSNKYFGLDDEVSE